jgi:hypothetical protein
MMMEMFASFTAWFGNLKVLIETRVGHSKSKYQIYVSYDTC